MTAKTDRHFFVDAEARTANMNCVKKQEEISNNLPDSYPEISPRF